MSQSRQLAAIMFTDILDYATLMQKEDKEVKRIKEKHHQVFDPIIQKYQGKVLQYYGGKTLSIFQSAIDAVECGINLQLGFRQDARIPVRIGIHMGDIVYSEDGVIGDGVNVASRVESLAIEGSVFISDKICDEVRNHKSIQTQALGTFHLKNVTREVDIYALSNEGLIVPGPEDIQGLSTKEISGSKSGRFTLNLRNLAVTGIFVLTILLIAWIFFIRNRDPSGKHLTGSTEKTIAVLPLINLTENLEHEYFSDGMTEDIITQLSKVGDLKVIARSSIMRYKKTTKSIQKIAGELGVVHVLEGSVRKYGDSVRVSIRLIDAKTDNNIWAKTFDREMTDIFEIQRDVAHEVAKALKAQLTQAENENINKKPTQNTEAYELYLQGLYHLRSGTMEGLNKSYPLLREAILLDPDFANAYAEIAGYYIRQGAWRGQLSPDVARDEAVVYINKSLALNPDFKLANTRLATIKFWYDWDLAGAERDYRKGGSSEVYGFFLLMMGRVKEAEAMFDEIYALNPFDAHDRPHRGLTQYFLGNPEGAIRILRDGVSLHPKVLTGYHKLGKIYLNQARYREAVETLEQGIAVGEERIPAILGELAIAYYKTGDHNKTTGLIKELETLKLKGHQGSPSFFLAQIYAGIGEQELAFEWLEKSYEAHEVEMIWLKIEPQFNSLRNDPRFSDLLRRVGF